MKVTYEHCIVNRKDYRLQVRLKFASRRTDRQADKQADIRKHLIWGVIKVIAITTILHSHYDADDHNDGINGGIRGTQITWLFFEEKETNWN